MIDLTDWLRFVKNEKSLANALSKLSNSKVSTLTNLIRDRSISDFEIEKFLSNQKGFGKKRIEKLLQFRKEFQSFSPSNSLIETVEFSRFCFERKISFSKSRLNLLLKTFENYRNLLKVLKENPYQLRRIKTFSFLTADAIALKIDRNYFFSDLRIENAIDHVLKDFEQKFGQSLIEYSLLIENALKILNKNRIDLNFLEKIEASDVERSIQRLIEKRRLRKIMIDQTSYLTIEDLARKEDFIYRKLIEINQSKRSSNFVFSRAEIDRFLKENSISLSKEQYRALTDILTSERRIFFVCGYAGSGKTFLLKVLKEFLRSKIKDVEIVSTAFTGLASERLRNVLKTDSSTLHRLLEIKFDGRSRRNTIDYDAVFVDESSLIDVHLFFELVNVLTRSKRNQIVIFVGDTEQIDPIGPCYVFHDLIQSKNFETFFLREVFRQAEAFEVLEIANQVRRSIWPHILKSESEIEIESFRFRKFKTLFFEKKRLEKLLRSNLIDKDYYRLRLFEIDQRLLKELIRQIRIDLESVYQNDQSRMRNEIVVLCAKKSKSEISTLKINRILQSILNSNSRSISNQSRKIKLNDRVIQLTNQIRKTKLFFEYENERDFKNFRYRRIFNGQIGHVIDLDLKQKKFVVLFDNSLVSEYDISEIEKSIDLSYAITVHKSQGSEFERVYLVFSISDFIFLDRKWFYTALTRTKKFLSLIVDDFGLSRAIENYFDTSKKTYLDYLIRLEKL